MTATLRKPSTIVAVAAFAAFLATFNETFLNVAFAPIMADLGVDVSTVQWLATAYMLGAAVMVPVSAFAYRSVPTRPLFVGTVALLVVGSVIGALAPSFPVLLAGRIVQALGTGLLIPIGMNITLEVAPREKLGTYMGIMGAMTTLGPSLSVIVAGVLLAAFSWHMLMAVFAVLSAACLVFGAVMLGDIAKLTHPKLDAPSVALVGVALIGLMYGVSTVFSGSIAVAVGAAVVGAAFLVLFVRRQKRLEQPLIDLRPLSVRPFAVGVVVNMLSLVTIFAMNIIVPTYLQSVLGMDSLVASLALFPAIMLSCVASLLAGRVYDRHGARVLLPVGFLLIGVFAALVSVFISTGSVLVIALLYIPVICGSALIIGPVQSFALSHLDPELNPHGVTVMSTGFQIAGCIGSSLFTGVYAAVLGGQAAAGASTFDAASTGFLAAGLLVAAFALVGFLLALRVRSYEKAQAAGRTADARADAPAAEAPLLASIMKADVWALPATATVLDAVRLFAERGISGAPVVNEQGNAVGFVSDGDVMRALADQTSAFKSAYSFVVERGNADFDQTVAAVMGQPVAEIATLRVISVDLHDELGGICKVLADKHLKKAPVMDGGRMVGIVNRSNIARYSMTSYLDGIAQEA
ncbi:MFS transporter [Gordonibacter pamelaeae]|uniref:MFS transporter n=1 Tax=Gordonibacter pamelaeae TaxID=471189 RepID=UPI0019D65C6D|nr:MFS transporter [Gordonibacter pamelaeae]MCQ4847384.1 MFS transporter [Gordonibacter pamelaeae]MCQ4849647.1 MFS transporter [Gordonibacter pamelaeae]